MEKVRRQEELAQWRGMRYRLAYIYADTASKLAKALERDLDAPIDIQAMACTVAWDAWLDADEKYRRAKEAVDDEG